MPADAFLDTNILVYAYDLDAGRKREVALAIVEKGWLEPGSKAMSVQVLQELYVNLVRKGRSDAEAESIIQDLSAWPVVENRTALLKGALETKRRWQVSLWDSLILAAAKEAGSKVWL